MWTTKLNQTFLSVWGWVDNGWIFTQSEASLSLIHNGKTNVSVVMSLYYVGICGATILHPIREHAVHESKPVCCWTLLSRGRERERARDRIYDLLIHFLNIRCCCGWTNIKKRVLDDILCVKLRIYLVSLCVFLWRGGAATVQLRTTADAQKQPSRALMCAKLLLLYLYQNNIAIRTYK